MLTTFPVFNVYFIGGGSRHHTLRGVPVQAAISPTIWPFVDPTGVNPGLDYHLGHRYGQVAPGSRIAAHDRPLKLAAVMAGPVGDDLFLALLRDFQLRGIIIDVGHLFAHWRRAVETTAGGLGVP